MTIVLKASGWFELPGAKLQPLYASIQRCLDGRRPEVVVRERRDQDSLTLAEAWGRYVRELYQVMYATLEAMRPRRDWFALQVRTTYHSEAAYPDSIIVGEGPDALQLRGMAFDPVVFDFPWIDNSMDRPWKPWGWTFSPFSDDLDETQYFFNPTTAQVTVHGASDLAYFGMTPRIPSSLARFELVAA